MRKEYDATYTSDELKKMRRISYIKMVAMFGFVIAIFAFSSIAWFTMSREVDGSGMQLTATGQRYIIKMVNGNNQGAYYNTYHSLIKESDAAVWLVDSSNNLDNASDVGIHPGSSGIMTFYVTPLADEVSLDFTLQLVGYTSSNSGGNVSMAPLSANVGDPAYYLNGHLLLFEDKPNNYYEDLIPVDSTGNRVLSRTFRRADLSTLGVDTDNDSKKDAFQVDAYWVWPETLSTLINTSDPTVRLLCDSAEQVQEGETSNYQQLETFLLNHPSYFLMGYDAATVLARDTVVDNYNDYGALYDRADQDIGSDVHFVLLKMNVGETNES